MEHMSRQRARHTFERELAEAVKAAQRAVSVTMGERAVTLGAPWAVNAFVASLSRAWRTAVVDAEREGA